MLVYGTLATLIIVYQKNAWSSLILKNKYITLMLCYITISLSSRYLVLSWIILLEEILFRGVFLQGVENNTKNNVLSGVIFGCYEMIYVNNVVLFMVFIFIGYFLCIAARVVSVYELAILRTMFYMLLEGCV
jgi:membrane protease YdiL (CAAX protease family)